MTTFSVTIYNFVKNVHYQLEFEEAQALQIYHLTKQMTDEDFKNRLYYLAITEDGNVESTNLMLLLEKIKSGYSNKPVTFFISSEKIRLGSSSRWITQVKKLIVMINYSIRVDLDNIFLPITWANIKERIYEKLCNNSITLDFDDLSISNNWKTTKGCTNIDDCIYILNNELNKFGETVMHVETITKTNKNTKKESKDTLFRTQKMIQNNLDEIMKGLDKLEVSVKNMSKDDVFVNIPLANEELFEFYDKIKTEKQLVDLKHSYEKYQQWLTLYGNDENKIESYLINQNEASSLVIRNSNITTTSTSSNIDINVDSRLISSKYNIRIPMKNLVNLKIFILDLNVCFKFTNAQEVSLPSGLSLEFDYKVKQNSGNENEPIQKTYCIDLIHGFGVNVSKTFTRFKHELGTNFHIQDIENARIIKKDMVNENNKNILYVGARDYFKEDDDDKPVRIFNFEVNKADNMAMNSTHENDIISTSIENTNSTLLNIDEYDLLTETDSNV